MKLHDLPALNATLNGISALFIILGWIFIKRSRTKAHILMMSCAVLTSSAFLTAYLIYHLNSKIVTKFTAPGLVRSFYFTLLITHIILAFATVPLVLATLVPALRARYDQHRRIAKWTLPVWLYVSITGVLVYLMLYQWFPPAHYSEAP
jgi:putative membrane protein